MTTTTKTRTEITYFHDGKPVAEVHANVGHIASLYTKGWQADLPRVSAGVLREFLAKHGVADPKAPGWMVKLPNGVTIECRNDGEASRFAGAPKAKNAAARPAPKKSVKKAPVKKASAPKKTAKKTAVKKAVAKSAARQVTPRFKTGRAN